MTPDQVEVAFLFQLNMTPDQVEAGLGRKNAIQETVSSSVVKTALDIDASAICVLSHTGATARAVAKYPAPYTLNPEL